MMLVDALIRTRGGIVDELNDTATIKPVYPPIDDPNNMALWAPSVRLHTSLFDLIAPLRFSSISATPGNPRPGAKLDVGASREIATLRRPSDAEFYVFFGQQLKLMESWAELRDERTCEILTQLTPQFAFWDSIGQLELDRRRWTGELISLALAFASFVEMRFKHALSVPRPVAYSRKIQPIIPTPMHGSFPSGHATEAYMVAHVLESLVPSGWQASLRPQLQALAARTSINRTIAGVHFPVDSQAGQHLGQSLAEYFVCLCTRDARWSASPPVQGGWYARSYNPLDVGAGNQDFDPAILDPGSLISDPAPSSLPPPSILGWQWIMARNEWPATAPV
ncbi:phosphatase PAP2 family protein [Variovorax sp. CF079]|uniref:phosphatase PAP2 family protein n=1 Tax=Variovorax sp. CF079 TaxID=1882774 RepID=UPI001FCE0A64|nr:phosphatase PAP2 family protein [Variovorax sp. CF079]